MLRVYKGNDNSDNREAMINTLVGVELSLAVPRTLISLAPTKSTLGMLGGRRYLGSKMVTLHQIRLVPSIFDLPLAVSAQPVNA